MVDFMLSDVQKALQTLAREFAQKEIKPVAAELDAFRDPVKCWSWDLAKKMSKVGFRTLPVDTKYGGGGVRDVLSNCIVAEELSVADPSITAAVMLSGLKMQHLLEEGTEEQRQKYLPAYCADDGWLSCNSITEPNSGADDVLPYDAVGHGLQTSVRKDGDYYILNGAKRFIQNAAIAKLDFCWARTDPTVGITKGVTCFIIPTDTPGWTAGGVDDKMGSRLTLNGDIFYNDVRVHKSQILGGWNKGIALFRAMLLKGDNLVNSARMIGTARAMLEESIAYTKNRIQGGVPIFQHQCVQLDLADMFMMIEAARAYLWYAVWRCDNQDKVPFDPKYGTMASVMCHEVVCKVAMKGLPMWGGSGIQNEVPYQKHLRDGLSFLHADGGVHIKRILAAKLL